MIFTVLTTAALIIIAFVLICAYANFDDICTEIKGLRITNEIIANHFTREEAKDAAEEVLEKAMNINKSAISGKYHWGTFYGYFSSLSELKAEAKDCEEGDIAHVIIDDGQYDAYKFDGLAWCRTATWSKTATYDED